MNLFFKFFDPEDTFQRIMSETAQTTPNTDAGIEKKDPSSSSEAKAQEKQAEEEEIGDISL